jgi:hypothetical protein
VLLKEKKVRLEDASRLTCDKSISLEIFPPALSKEHIRLVEKKNAAPSVGKGEIGLQRSLYLLSIRPKVTYKRKRDWSACFLKVLWSRRREMVFLLTTSDLKERLLESLSNTLWNIS